MHKQLREECLFQWDNTKHVQFCFCFSFFVFLSLLVFLLKATKQQLNDDKLKYCTHPVTVCQWNAWSVWKNVGMTDVWPMYTWHTWSHANILPDTPGIPLTNCNQISIFSFISLFNCNFVAYPQNLHTLYCLIKMSILVCFDSRYSMPCPNLAKSALFSRYSVSFI